MAEENKEASLQWVAGIDFSQIPKDIARIEELFSQAADFKLDPEGLSAPIKEAEEQIRKEFAKTAEVEINLREQVASDVAAINSKVTQQQIDNSKATLSEIDKQLKAVKDFQDIISGTNLEFSSISSDSSLLNVLTEATKFFKDLDPDTKELVNSLLQLEFQLEEIRAKQVAVEVEFEQGKIGMEEYAKATAFLALQEKAISDNIDNVIRKQKALREINEAEVGSIDQKRLALKLLNEEYAALSEADRGSEVGQQLVSQIQQLDQQIKALDPKKLKEFKEETITVSAELSKLLNDMARNPESPLFEEWKTRAIELQKTISDVRSQVSDATKDQDTGYINDQIKALKELERAYDSLSEAEVKGDKGAELRRQITAIKIEIKNLEPEKVEKVKDKIQSAAAELKKLKDLMVRNPESPLFESWRDRAAELTDSIEGVNREIKIASSDSGGIDALSSGVKGLVGAWSAVSGAVSVFTGENEAAEKAIQRTMAALAILNGVQEISKVLEKESALNIYLTGLMRKKDAAATVAQTVATTAQTTATTSATVATRTLTAAMLANPAATLVVVISALVGAYLLLRKETIEVRKAQDLLAEAAEKVTDSYADQKAKIIPYLEALKQSNLTEHQRLEIYEKLKSIDPSIVQGIEAKTLSYDSLTRNVQAYVQSLREKIRLETNQEAISASIKAEEALRKQIETQQRIIDIRRKSVADANKIRLTPGSSAIGAAAGTRDDQASLTAAKEKMDELTSALVNQQRVTEELGASAGKIVNTQNQLTESRKRTIAVIDKEIALLKSQQSELSETSTQYKQFQAEINKLEAERKKITGESNKDIKTRQKEEDKLNAILDKRRAILEAILALERDAAQSGMLKEQSELDRINEKYDKQVVALKKVNEEIALFNKRNPKSRQNLLGDAELSRIEAARAIEVANFQYKQDADLYIESLKTKEAAFSEWQKIQQEGSIELMEVAREQYGEQVGDFTTYLEFLRAEMQKMIPKLLAGDFNVGDMKVFEALNKAFIDEQIRSENDRSKQQVENYRKLLASAKTYNLERSKIEKNYNDLFETLEKNRTKMSVEEYKARKEALEDQREEELKVIAESELKKYNAFRQYEKGFDNLGIRATRSLVTALKKLRDEMKDNVAMVNLLNKAIKDTEAGASEKSKESFGQVIDLLNSSIDDFGIKMSKTLTITVRQLAEVAANVQTLFDSNASTTEQVGSIIGLVSFVITSVRDALLSAEDMANPLQDQIDYYTTITNQIEAQNMLLIRQKTLLDDLAGQTRVDSVLDYMDALKKKEADSLEALRKLQVDVIKSQKEVFIDPILGTEMENRGFTGLWTQLATGGQAKTKIKYELEAVDTSDLESIEDFANLLADIKANGGKLNGKAVIEEDIKALELLIETYDQAIEEQKALKRELDQLFTGTTTAAIADSIIEGFKQGKRTMQDFAGDFEKLMTDAIMNSLRYQTLEEPIKEFYEQFSQASGQDGILTPDEIDALKRRYEEIIRAAAAQFENLQQITEVDLTGVNQANSLSGAIRGMTEQQAELLAGQFGGLRITAIDQLRMATESLAVLNDIRYNTGFLEPSYAVLQETRAIIKDLQLNGIKVK